MKFEEFQAQRENLLKDHPELTDCAETNLYRTLQHLKPLIPCQFNREIRRQELVEQWMGRFGLLPGLANLIHPTEGVRHSLRLIFRHYASIKGRVWIPEDNYPTFLALARDEGLAPKTFPTLKEFKWPEETETGAHELVLATNPLVPHGRWLADSELTQIETWLAQSPRRRVVIDSAYSLDTGIHPSNQRLYETSQAILLHSLTKGWLHPNLFGVAMVPARDSGIWLAVLQCASLPAGKRAIARHLLSEHSSLPCKVAKAIADSREHMMLTIPELADSSFSTRGDSYYTPVRSSWSTLFEQGVLSIPAPVFGSRRDDIAILSSLSFTSGSSRTTPATTSNFCAPGGSSKT